MNKSEITIPNLELYDKLIQLNPDIERKGKTNPYTSLNGHMFSFLSKEGLMGLRLSKSDREEFIKKFNSNLIEQHGRIMKEYVEVPLSVLSDTETISNYLQKSFNYVATLKPKKTTR